MEFVFFFFFLAFISLFGEYSYLMIQSFLFIIEMENAKYVLSKILLQLRHPQTHVLSSDLDTSTPDFESK